MNNFKQKAIRGGVAKMCAQGANFSLRIGSVMILSRLLEPKDFGLVGMVTAFTGILSLFKDFGLSTAAIQRSSVTEEEISSLFWINLLIGGVLALLALALSPVVATFYGEPRLMKVTAILATGLLFNAAGVQHAAILQRDMRFTTTASIEIAALALSIALGIAMALSGYGYWSLVAMTVITPVFLSTAFWITTKWIPRRPNLKTEIRSMLQFGGAVTLNGLVVYIAYNLEKVLLGRFWGADSVGMYIRAYQLVSIPTDNLNSAVGGVAFSALSRLQHDFIRFKRYFLKGYSLVLAMSVPITITCALFADDVIAVALGPKWKDAALIFRLLAPTILIFAIINPLAWLMFALGMVGRSLRVALVLCPIVIGGYLLGLPYGPKGVAFAYSSAMTLWVVPHVAWCVRGTGISFRDIATAVGRPLLSCVVAGGLSLTVVASIAVSWQPLPRLILATSVLLTVYLGLLLFAMGQKRFYLDLLQHLKPNLPVEQAQ